MKIEEIDDSAWAIPLKKAQAEGNLHKKLRVTVLFNREAFDSHLRPITGYFLQDLELKIPDILEYAHLYLRPVPARQLGKIWMQGIVCFINLLEGSTQPMAMHVHYARTCYHVSIKKVGKETPISRKEATEMSRSGKIFCVIANDIPTRPTEVNRIYRAS